MFLIIFFLPVHLFKFFIIQFYHNLKKRTKWATFYLSQLYMEWIRERDLIRKKILNKKRKQVFQSIYIFFFLFRLLDFYMNHFMIVLVLWVLSIHIFLLVIYIHINVYYTYFFFVWASLILQLDFFTKWFFNRLHVCIGNSTYIFYLLHTILNIPQFRKYVVFYWLVCSHKMYLRGQKKCLSNFSIKHNFY